MIGINVKLWMAICMVAILTCFASCNAPGGKPSENAQAGNNTFSTLDGTSVSLADYQGQVVFLNYWATWCKPCIGEMPDIEKARQILAEEGVVFLAASDEDITKIQSFKAKNDYQFTYLRLNVDFSEREVYSLPTTVIYRPDGSVAKMVTGAVDWSSPEMIAEIRAAKDAL